MAPKVTADCRLACAVYRLGLEGRVRITVSLKPWADRLAVLCREVSPDARRSVRSTVSRALLSTVFGDDRMAAIVGNGFEPFTADNAKARIRVTRAFRFRAFSDISKCGTFLRRF